MSVIHESDYTARDAPNAWQTEKKSLSVFGRVNCTERCREACTNAANTSQCGSI